jgi:hypothetical protein
MYSPDLVDFTGDILPHTQGNEYYGHHASYGMTPLAGGCRKSYALSRQRGQRVAEPVRHVAGHGAICARVRQGFEGALRLFVWRGVRGSVVAGFGYGFGYGVVGWDLEERGVGFGALDFLHGDGGFHAALGVAGDP